MFFSRGFAVVTKNGIYHSTVVQNTVKPLKKVPDLVDLFFFDAPPQCYWWKKVEKEKKWKFPSQMHFHSTPTVGTI